MNKLLSGLLGTAAVLCTAALPVAALEGVPAYNKIQLTVEACSVRFEKSDDATAHYIYDEQQFVLTAREHLQTLVLTIQKAPTAKPTDFTQEAVVVVQLPDIVYDAIVINAKNRAHIRLETAQDADFVFSGQDSALSVTICKGFARKLKMELSGGSGGVAFAKDASDYTFLLHSRRSAIGVSLPNYKPNQPYQYKSGDGGAEIKVRLTNAAFVVNVLK